ncbi:MAG: putative Ig domain-containing protein [Candidatus Neomarinimicrobiota bacterium]
MVYCARFRGILAFLSVLFLCGSLSGQQVVALNGTYDFDGDGLSEFLSIEKAGPGVPYSEVAAYYEIDEQGSHLLLWGFTSSRPLIDARIGDMDGNGAPEIIVLTGGSLLGSGDSPSWLHWFPWDEDSFSEGPRIEWSGERSAGSQKPFGFTIIDSDNDSRDEIALAVGSPNREILLLTLNVMADAPLFEIARSLSSPAVSSGYGQIALSTVDQDRDGFWDLMAIMRELSTLKVQIFSNEGGDLVGGPSYEEDIAQVSPRFSRLVQSAINTIDIDQDGTHTVILPFETGSAVAIKAYSDRLALVPVEVEVASLFALPKTGVEETVINEILLERAESGITGMRVRKLELEAKQLEVPTAPEEAVEVPPTAPPARKVKRLELTAVEDTVSTEVLSDELLDTTGQAVVVELPVIEREVSEEVAPATPGKVRKLDLTTVEKRAEAPALAPTPGLPADVTATDTVMAGETYTHSLEPDEKRQLHAFRPSTLPSGAFFDPPTRTIVWTPSENQVGVHRLAYEVEFEVTGERVNVEEVEGTGVQVLSITETDTVELYILVRSEIEP